MKTAIPCMKKLLLLIIVLMSKINTLKYNSIIAPLHTKIPIPLHTYLAFPNSKMTKNNSNKI